MRERNINIVFARVGGCFPCIGGWVNEWIIFLILFSLFLVIGLLIKDYAITNLLLNAIKKYDNYRVFNILPKIIK